MMWVTIGLIGISCICHIEGESLRIDSAGQHLAQGLDSFPPGRDKADQFQAEEGRKTSLPVSVSKSVSKVSVKFGGISVRQRHGKDREREEDSEEDGKTGEVEEEVVTRDVPEVRQSKKLFGDTFEDSAVDEVEARVRQSFFQRLLSQLQSLATVRVQEEEVMTGYQLVYRDDSSEELEEYGDAPIVYSEEYEEYMSEGVEKYRSDVDDYMSENTSSTDEDNDTFHTTTQGQEEELGPVRSVEARGRTLGVGVWGDNVGVSKHDDLEKEVMEEVRSGLSDGLKEEFIGDVEVVIDRSTVELFTFRDKIGVFIGVIMIVITISVVLGVIGVSIHRSRRGKIMKMMKEDELSVDTVSSVLESCHGHELPDSVYSSYIRRSSLSCDELTELDNDSFLTSLETISVMDQFTWD